MGESGGCCCIDLDDLHKPHVCLQFVSTCFKPLLQSPKQAYFVQLILDVVETVSRQASVKSCISNIDMNFKINTGERDRIVSSLQNVVLCFFE